MLDSALSQRQVIGPGLGASEIAAAAGLDPFKSPLQLWLEHTGQCEPFSGNDVTDWGLEVEPALLNWYGNRHRQGDEVMRRPMNSLYRETPSWARATPDAIIHAGDVMGPVLRLVQAKNVGWRMLHRWQDGPPDWVVCQTAWEAFVAGVGRVDVVVSLGGGPPEVYTLWRDEQMVADLLAIGERFMKHVADRTEPRTTHHEDWAAYLARRAESRGFIVPIDSADHTLADEWRAATAEAKRSTQRLDLAKNRVRRYLADANADGMETAAGLATWRPDRNGNRSLRQPRGWGGEGS